MSTTATWITANSLNLSLHEANGDVIEFSALSVGTKSAGTCHYDVFVTINGVETQVLDDYEVGKNGIISVTDPNANDAFLIESVRIVKVDGNAVKIGLGGIQFILPPDDVQLSFTTELKDGDNDAVTAGFVVDIDGNNDGNYDATTSSSAILPSGPVLNLSLLGSSELTHAHHDLFFA